MMRARLLGGLLGSGLLIAIGAPAAAETQSFVDLQGTVGYSTNPLLQPGPNLGSGFGRLSAYGYHGWSSERGETSLSAYLENNFYFKGYGDQQLFSLSARTERRASETVNVFGSLSFSGDLGGQLGTRFFGNPLQELPTDTTVPPPTQVITSPDLAALNRRQYRLTGQGGATFVLSPRDFLSTVVGAQRVFFNGSDDTFDYNFYNTAIGWQRRVNERTNIGVQVIAEYADYRGGRSIVSYGPQLTASTRLDQALQLSGAIGVVRTERDLESSFGGKDSSLDLAFDASLCRNLEYDQLCAKVIRRTQSSVIGAAPATTSINADYVRKLSANDSIQLSAGYARTASVPELGLGRRSYYSVSGNYDRRLSDRLSAGVSVSGRKLSQFGPDYKADLSGSFYIRNRIGSLR